MKTQDVIVHFGTKTEVAKRLSIRAAAVSQWGEYPPMLRQLQIETMTNGQLKAEPTPAISSPEAA